ncbi:MAG: histidine kinase N-terminal 7TM domain-containing protein [Acidobacteriaceae bacterium]
MSVALLSGLKLINQLLTAGIAITAFSLLLYALTFNLRDRVARSFALILMCVVVVFVGDAISSIVKSNEILQRWLQFEWLGIVFLPASYFQFSEALLATTGRPTSKKQKWLIRLVYLVSLGFLATLPPLLLVGPLVPDASPAPHLARTWLTWIFAAYFVGVMIWSWINFRRTYQRTVTPTSRRRMRYLITGALAPVLGSYPFLLFGSGLATHHPLLFWLVAVLSNLLVVILLVIMAYSVAFFGVSWPDRVVKRRLFKWLMRGPVTGSSVLAMTTLVRRVGEFFGFEYTAAVPIVMVGTLLLFEYAITMAAPLWDRWSFQGGDKSNLQLVQTLNERLLTTGDLRQFLESVLAAICDRVQAPTAFIIALNAGDLELMVNIGDFPSMDEMSAGLNHVVAQNGNGTGFFIWNNYWLVPIHGQRENAGVLLGILGIARKPESALGDDQKDAITLLAERAATALEDHVHQQEIFNSIETLSPQIEMIQRLRAASRYGDANVLTAAEIPIESPDLVRWVKEALSHYWGGTRLTDSPLLKLRIVQKTLGEHDDNPANALRAILRQAVEQVRPEGERRFTGEWILYNILEMKFMEGKKVREVATRLAMSEADLYRKQRVAVEAVASAILDMEHKARAD